MQYRKNNQQIGENLNRMLWKQIPLFLLVLLSLVSCNKDDKPIKEPNQKAHNKQARLPDFTKDVYPCPYPQKGLRCIPRGQDCRILIGCKGSSILTLDEIGVFFPEIESWEQWINYGRITNRDFFKYIEDRGYCEKGTFKY